LEDRNLWDEYQAAYEIMLHKRSTVWAPWYVIPADRKWARIAAIVRETLEAMNPQYLVPTGTPRISRSNEGMGSHYPVRPQRLGRAHGRAGASRG
jgi:hypothetical protein